MKSVIVILVLVVFLSFTVNCFAGKDQELYDKAVNAANTGNIDFSFMYYSSILRDYSNSDYYDEALFANGEYYFLIPDYTKSKEILNTFVEDYPDSDAIVFALAMLMKIAEDKDNEDEKAILRKKIATYKRVSLVFKESEEYEYLSPLNRKYKAVFYINKIVFYVEGDLFVRVPF